MKKKMTSAEKNMKISEQRFTMTVILCNVLDSENGVSNKIKSAVASSLLNMIEMSMIPKEDELLIQLINNSIDGFCSQIENEHGVENYKSELLASVQFARHLMNEIGEKTRRIKEGEEILKNICLN